MTQSFQYLAPPSRAELLNLFSEHGESAKALAGGTDILVNIRIGLARPRLLVNVKKVEGFGQTSFSEKEGLVIRPAVTLNDILRNRAIRERYPLLAACAHDLASYQIRNRATVIGNVVNASPCSDMAPALLCLGASALISSRSGQRVVPFREFFKGVKETVLRPSEILEAILVPAASAGARGSYRKLKRIQGHDLGIVGVAVMKQNGLLRLGISSCAPTPILVDGLSESDPADTVVAAARAAIRPISDLRCSKEYREHMVEVFVRRLLEEVPS
jgi:carbon-monoxide dehydrogenase medium subunit